MKGRAPRRQCLILPASCSPGRKLAISNGSCKLLLHFSCHAGRNSSMRYCSGLPAARNRSRSAPPVSTLRQLQTLEETCGVGRYKLEETCGVGRCKLEENCGVGRHKLQAWRTSRGQDSQIWQILRFSCGNDWKSCALENQEVWHALICGRYSKRFYEKSEP